MLKKSCLGIALALLCAVVPVFGQNGVIKQLAGTVELKRAGASNFTPAQAGDQVAQNTIVSTGFKSSAVINIGSSVITVRPLTVLSLAEIAALEKTETVGLELQAGRVRVRVDPPSGQEVRFTVRSPSATASVRGTEFDMDTQTLQVSRGVVAYTGQRGASYDVRAGASSEVTGATEKVLDPITLHLTEVFPRPPVSGPPGPEVFTPTGGLPGDSSGIGKQAVAASSFVFVFRP